MTFRPCRSLYRTSFTTFLAGDIVVSGGLTPLLHGGILSPWLSRAQARRHDESACAGSGHYVKSELLSRQRVDSNGQDRQAQIMSCIDAPGPVGSIEGSPDGNRRLI